MGYSPVLYSWRSFQSQRLGLALWQWVLSILPSSGWNVGFTLLKDATEKESNGHKPGAQCLAQHQGLLWKLSRSWRAILFTYNNLFLKRFILSLPLDFLLVSSSWGSSPKSELEVDGWGWGGRLVVEMSIYKAEMNIEVAGLLVRTHQECLI